MKSKKGPTAGFDGLNNHESYLYLFYLARFKAAKIDESAQGVVVRLVWETLLAKMSNSIKQPAAKVVHPLLQLLQLQWSLGVMEETNMRMSSTGTYTKPKLFCYMIEKSRQIIIVKIFILLKVQNSLSCMSSLRLF